MIIFTILAIALLVIAAIATIACIICGAGVVALFGDLIVFGLIVWLLIKVFRRRK